LQLSNKTPLLKRGMDDEVCLAYRRECKKEEKWHGQIDGETVSNRLVEKSVSGIDSSTAQASMRCRCSGPTLCYVAGRVLVLHVTDSQGAIISAS